MTGMRLEIILVLDKACRGREGKKE